MVKFLLDGKRPRKHDREVIAAGARINSNFPQVFRLVRSHGWMHLPSRSIVSSWLRKFNLREGQQSDLVEAEESLTGLGMLCLTNFDEVRLLALA